MTSPSKDIGLAAVAANLDDLGRALSLAAASVNVSGARRSLDHAQRALAMARMARGEHWDHQPQGVTRSRLAVDVARDAVHAAADLIQHETAGALVGTALYCLSAASTHLLLEDAWERQPDRSAA